MPDRVAERIEFLWTIPASDSFGAVNAALTLDLLRSWRWCGRRIPRDGRCPGDGRKRSPSRFENREQVRRFRERQLIEGGDGSIRSCG